MRTTTCAIFLDSTQKNETVHMAFALLKLLMLRTNINDTDVWQSVFPNGAGYQQSLAYSNLLKLLPIMERTLLVKVYTLVIRTLHWRCF